VAERFKAVVLKTTVLVTAPGVRIPPPPPQPFAAEKVPAVVIEITDSLTGPKLPICP
jgi:hypothetical protein